MTGSAQTRRVALGVFRRRLRIGEGSGEGRARVFPDRRLADDGKRLGLSESALDVASAIVKNFLN